MGKNKHQMMAYQHNETRALYSGPIPPASELEKYNQVLPGLAERIMKMAEIQSAHRQELEKKVIHSKIKESKLGQLLGFIIGMSGLGIVAFCAYIGSPILAGAIAAIDIVGLAGVFVYGSTQARREREQKDAGSKK